MKAGSPSKPLPSDGTKGAFSPAASVAKVVCHPWIDHRSPRAFGDPIVSPPESSRQPLQPNHVNGLAYPYLGPPNVLFRFPDRLFHPNLDEVQAHANRGSHPRHRDPFHHRMGALAASEQIGREQSQG